MKLNQPKAHSGKRKGLYRGLILILVAICFSACATILYGYKKVTYVDQEWSNKLATKVGIDSQHVLFLDSVETANWIKLSCSSNQSIQPLQLHYVAGDSMVSSYFNCYAKGNLSRLTWIFENDDHKLVDGDCVFLDKEVNKQLRDLVNVRTDDFLVVVFSSMFKKQSEQLVEIATKRAEELNLFLVNIDAYYASLF